MIFILRQKLQVIRMFNGIIETTGIITHYEKKADCIHLTVSPHQAFANLSIGDSVAINGVCLTITEFNDQTFVVTLVPETLRLICAEQMMLGNSVNLERAMKANGRMGGHYVQGHIDGTGMIIAFEPDGEGGAMIAKISMPKTLAKYIVNKGYIAIDGMSITVIEACCEWFSVTLIPHTQAVTISKHYRVSSCLNIEVDILSKYVEKLLRSE